jgi:DNA/RNA-binding domain of Phe-tRNA-synthetase-like protein
MLFSLAPALHDIVRPGVLLFEGMSVVEREPRLDAPLREAECRVRALPPAERAAVRAMYRKVGLDPTRRRPSSEALLRRVLRGDALPRVNVLVDVCNWCSLELQLPYGVYDAARVSGDVELRRGAAGEEYPGIGKDVVHVDGRLTLTDALGPFGNPSSDSARTSVATATTSALAVIYAPADLPRGSLTAALDLTARRILEFAGGREAARFVV